MKTKLFLGAIMLVIISFSCKSKKDDTTPVDTSVKFTATLNGANETPPNQSAATGSGNFTYTPSTRVLSGTVTYTGMTPTAAHIHRGEVGVAGPVIFPVGTAPFTSPISFTTVALDSTQLSDLMAGRYYVNIHSETYPGGEIRGQLVKH